MKNVLSTCALALGLLASPVSSPALAQSASPVAIEMTVRADTPGAVIHKNIYGQFSEHLGTGIYEGIWVGPESRIPNTRGFRNDVLGALKDLSVPVLRWPGGCYADEYHWRNGVGPRRQRPKTVNASWGDVVETNAFGTHEFFDLAETLGAETYVNINMGSGTPAEMMDWLEYMTSTSKSDLAEWRRRNGRDQPFRIHHLGIGNETWGCGGGMRPAYYADQFRQFASFVRIANRENRPVVVASGANEADYNWTDIVMASAARNMGATTVHYYTLPTGKWNKKGAATGFPESEWISTFANTLKMETMLAGHIKVMDRYDPQKRIALYVDEWGTWYDVEPGTNPSFLYQQNTVRDALVAAVNFNIFHQSAERVKMSNIAQTVNVLQAMVLTDGPNMALTPTYHAFHMYKPFMGATNLPVEIRAPRYEIGEFSVPMIHASSARTTDGAIVIGLANLDPNRTSSLSINLKGVAGKSVSGQVLTGQAMDSHNKVGQPPVVVPQPLTGAVLEGERLKLDIPAKSVVVVQVK